MSALVRLLTGLTALAVMGAVSVTDPTGDSVGDGTIVAPTAPRYANNAIFDLQDVSLEVRPRSPGGSIVLLPAEGDGEAGEGAGEGRSEEGADAPAGDGAGVPLDDVRSVLRVTLGAIDVSESTALGFGSVVIDLYLDGAQGGREVALAGPDMLLPAGRGWEYAVRLTPDGATGYRYLPPDVAAGVLAVPDEDAADVEDDPLGAGGSDLQSEVLGDERAAGGVVLDDEQVPVGVVLDYERVPVGVVLDGSTLVVETPWDFPGDVTVFALTGVHDPFNPSGWRPLADAPSPWAYSGGEQVAPVIDLLAPSQEAQERALRTGVLPMPSVPARDAGTVWLVLMLIGVLVALTGLVLRRRVPRATGSQLRTGLPPEPVSQRTAGQRQVLVVAPAPAVDQSAEPVVRERVVPRVVPTEPGLASDVAAPDDATGRSDADGEREPAGRSEVGEPTDPAGPSTRAEPPLPVAAPEPEDTPASPEEAPALSGVSAFDSFVLLEATMEEQEDEGFGELTREKGSAN